MTTRTPLSPTALLARRRFSRYIPVKALSAVGGLAQRATLNHCPCFRYDEIASTFELRRKEWEPDRIRDARTLAPATAAAQLDFFDAGLLSALESALHPKLTEDIGRIMQRCRMVYAQQSDNANFDDVLAPVFRLVFRLIAAKMLIDRRHQPEWINLDAPGVIAAIDNFYFSKEIPKPILQNAAVQSAAWQQVQQRLFLQNLSVETLAYLYENAFVTEELRRDQSIHATPPEVADYLIRQLPIEKLPVMERRVFEPFAGHAPFLTAALRRLRELLPKDISPQERHDYFVAMLSGIENEPFAWEIARYALILADYPNPDGWRISDQDAFSGPDFDALLQAANIVLCNPPFGKFDPQERQTAGDNAAFLKEVEVLRRVISKRPAMFGFVLPRPFLDRSAFRALRQDIVTHYSNVHITALPDKTFNKASQEVVLLAAYNIALPDSPYSYAAVTSKGYDEFLRTSQPTWKDSYTTLKRTNNDVMLWRTPLQSVWDALQDHEKLGTLAEPHRGIEYKKGFIDECVSDEPQPNFLPGIATVRNYLEDYVVRDYQYLSTDTKKMERSRKGLKWDQPKVLINRMLLSRECWNIAAAIDEEGLLASVQFYGVWPRGNTSIELLSAIISGPVANAYLFSYPSKRENQIRWIKQIPVPSFTAEQRELVVWLVQEYYSQRGQWLALEGLDAHFEAKCLELLYWIDAAVLEAYALPAELERELLGQFDGAERRPLPFHFPGYGEEYERAKESLQRERAYRAVLKQYHTLVDKKYLDGLTAADAEEMERLRQQIGAYNAPFYKPLIAALEAETR